MDRPPSHDGTAGRGRPVDAIVETERRGDDVSVMRGQPDVLPVDQKDCAILRSTERLGVLRDRVEHWLHVGWRGGDRAQDLRDRRLAFERLLRLVEEANV